MIAYVIVDIDVTDPEGYKEYVKVASETVKLYSGRYLARGGQNEHSKAIGMQIVSSSWNLKTLTGPSNGSIQRNMHLRAPCDINRRFQIW